MASYDRTYGLALCRGDASSNDCKACVLAASSEILKLCPNDKGAIIWYEACYLKYMDADFFGKIDEDQLSMWNLNNVSMIEPQKLDQMVHELLANLSQKASETPKMFARGELKMDESLKTHGMVQCSRNLSDVDCQKCLSDSISTFCCNGKQAGGMFNGSCYVRYDIHPFINLYIN
ncbi:antimicrobial ginkbilobin-2-like protein [Primulina tabacum]|uniref:antimicrobial ginkbilobin-2-like protein n=1 Tax=Primulina tabacum TaxID=48773 RepID=UPI003F596EBE